MTILKIHGASGAGKTTAVRALMSLAAEVTPVKTLQGKTVGHIMGLLQLGRDVAVLGSYDGANCGGVDTVGTAEEVMQMIDNFAGTHHVIHEGLLQSTYYGAMGEHSEGFENYIYAFLDTPLAVCQGRVILRREANKTKRAYDPEKNVAKYRTINRLKDRLLAENPHRVAILNYDAPMGPQLLHLLESK